ncbi:MAG TPA: hypothetical protein VFR40_16320 [Lapillicoccus sp.]|nr:hypothetical protein [Lapillicoccus sp.]
MHPRHRATAIVAATVAATTLGASAAIALPTKQADPQPGGSSVLRAVPAAGTFYPTPVARLLGSANAGYAVQPGSAATVAAAGQSGLPSSGVSAVVVNVVATAGPADAALSFGPSGAAGPPPLLVAPAGTTRSALLTLPLAAGSLDVTTTAAAAVQVDLVGFYAADDTVIGTAGVSGGYQPVDVTRLYDSDTTQPLAAGGQQVLAVDLGTAASPHTTALLVRATAKGAQAPGTLSLGSAVATVPSVPYAAGAPASNLAVVPTTPAADGRLDVTVTNTSTGATGLTLDLVGFYDDGALGPNLRFRPLPQTRVVDTAVGVGTTALQPGRPTTVTPSEGVVGDSTFGLVGVVTAAPSGASAGLDVELPDASPGPDVEVAAGATSVAVQPEVGAARGLGLQVRAGSPATNVTMDVTGSFEAYPPVTNPAARGWVAPVSGWQVSAEPR